MWHESWTGYVVWLAGSETMLCLKYPEPEVVSAVHPAGSVFVLPPQGAPGISCTTRDNLERLRGHLAAQLGRVECIRCQP